MKTLSSSINQRQSEGFYEFTSGIDVDRFLYKEEIEIQKAWVVSLSNAGILSSSEVDLVLPILGLIESEIQADTFQWRLQDEDIHMTIERSITERIGDVGKKIHLGRSRNDLIATTLKMYLANRCVDFSTMVSRMASTFLNFSQRDIEVIVPAYTHSQAAQPVRMAHLWNFHALNFTNDVKRFESCRKRLLELMPLGSGAIAGTHVDIDLDELASILGFGSPPLNSIHGVSDRDGVIEAAQTLSIFGVHITRLCEDIIFWSSTQMRLLQLPPEWASGSSMMPNKRNPDFFEIARAKGKRLSNISGEILSLNAGLPSGYASDFHEQKRVIVFTVQNLQLLLPILSEALSCLTIDSERASILLQSGHILATDVANEIVSQGTPFRDAYREVAEGVVDADKRGTQLGTPRISFQSAVESRNNSGGTARKRIQDSIRWMRESLSRSEKWRTSLENK